MTVPNVCEGVEADIAAAALGDPAIASSGLAHAARALAVQLDNDPTPNAAALCVGELRKVLAELRALAPEPEVKDGLDAIQGARSDRRGRVADTPAG